VNIPADKVPVIVYGAGGHGKVVADILRACGVEVEGFVDDDPLKCRGLSGLKLLGGSRWLIERAANQSTAVALGIGDNFIRHTVAEQCAGAGIQLVTAIHPSATIAVSAKISSGVVIMAHAVVNPDAAIGQGAIINTAAVVEHDCKVGTFAHLSPNVAIGGNVEVGDFSWLGIGASVIPKIKIGAYSIVGAGATVIHNIDDWTVAVGTPARSLKQLARHI
jgi:sugar O-acyltransferase (sialic acid O-acetyltransferase NeuD family)